MAWGWVRYPIWRRSMVEWVLLYRTEREWRVSIGEDPPALSCGALDLDPGADVERARAALRVMLLRDYRCVPAAFRWEHLGDDRWGGAP